eukprot:CAMPEP_0119131642 /NCGR_PEP_ID=MMETSP1310-20130426/10495_1 /TAXON_ID=464262 /ORGANISM="Genus nov. species nov., Strain RCC2339" /LENGTH=312 /DNA_ID=CAMNT_0007122229 /DNA_START=162 /DNA_END=1097 /DNA_ORIENTATION=+
MASLVVVAALLFAWGCAADEVVVQNLDVSGPAFSLTSQEGSMEFRTVVGAASTRLEIILSGPSASSVVTDGLVEQDPNDESVVLNELPSFSPSPASGPSQRLPLTLAVVALSLFFAGRGAAVRGGALLLLGLALTTSLTADAQTSAIYSYRVTLYLAPGQTFDSFRLDLQRGGNVNLFGVESRTFDLDVCPVTGEEGILNMRSLVVRDRLEACGNDRAYLEDVTLPEAGTVLDVISRSGTAHYEAQNLPGSFQITYSGTLVTNFRGCTSNPGASATSGQCSPGSNALFLEGVNVNMLVLGPGVTPTPPTPPT